MEALLASAHGITKRFSKLGPSALDAVDIEILPGRMTGLVGPDGAGKTTLIRLLTGLLDPDSGTVQVGGVAANSEDRSAIGYMPQRFGLYEDLSVIENLSLYAELRGLDPALREESFRRLLAFTDLELVERLSGSPNVRRIVSIGSASEVRDAIDGRSVIAVVMLDQQFSANVTAHRPALIRGVYDGRRSNSAQIVSAYLDRIVADMGASIEPTATVGLRAARSRSMVTNWYNPNLDYLWFTMPGLVVIISMVSELAVTAQTVARERELGTFDQLMVSPLRVYETLIGKMVPPLLVGAFNVTLYLLLIPTVFGVPLTGSLFVFYVAFICYMCALIGVGMLVSALSQTQQQAFLGAFLIIVPVILLSGFASPVDNMPGWLQVLAQANPAKHFLIVSEGVFLQAMPAAEVLANTWPLAVIALVTLTASSLLFRSRME